MNRLLKIARSAMPGTRVQFCQDAYGKHGIGLFLRDVLAMANAAVEGPRYIVTGIAVDEKKQKSIKDIDRRDFSGKPSYQSLVSEFIEPPIRLHYQPVSLDDKCVGVYEIGDCQDRPYMMRIDYSERLRRGDAYTRVGDVPIKLGRKQLQHLFESKFRLAVSRENIEIGFPGDIIHKELKIPVTNLAQLPSAIAGAKLQQMLDIRQKFTNSGLTTVMARLTHARLFGSDRPYEDRNADDLMREMAEIRHKHQHEDDHFLFEKNAQKLQLIVYNQGDCPIENAALSLVMPNHSSLHVATRLPKLLRDNRWMDRAQAEYARYPNINLKDDSVQVSSTLGDLATDAPVQVFEAPLRICVGDDLKGHKLAIRYSLFGSNLRKPASGKLHLVF